MTIKQPVINTFERVGIDYKELVDRTDEVEVFNRFGGDSCITSPLIAKLIDWVYDTNDAIDAGHSSVKLADFDRVRYFIAETDPKAYSACID